MILISGVNIIRSSSALLQRSYFCSYRLMRSGTKGTRENVNLNKFIQKVENRKRFGLPQKGLSDLLCNPNFLMAMYEDIKKMSRSSSINRRWFVDSVETIRKMQFRFKPVKVVYIPKLKGKERKLSLPRMKDKIIQKGMYFVLNVVFDDTFSKFSFGFRPNKGCHSALWQVQNAFTACNWLIKVDIRGCFDNIDHNTLTSLVCKNIKDPIFENLFRKFLKNHYFDPRYKIFEKNLKGIPQGASLRPLLCNIYLDGFDKFMEGLKGRFDRGVRRRSNPVFNKMLYRKLDPSLLRIPRSDPCDPNYKRLQFCRYADDVIIGVIGSYKDACALQTEIKTWLKDNLSIEVNENKRFISSSKGKGVPFLGYNIRLVTRDMLPLTFNRVRGRHNIGSVSVRLEISKDLIFKKLKERGFVRFEHRPCRYTGWVNLPLDEIINNYNLLGRGIIKYYSMATNYHVLNHVWWVLKQSCMLTFASKMRLKTMKKVFLKYGDLLEVKKSIGEGSVKLIDPSFAKRKVNRIKKKIYWSPFRLVDIVTIRMKRSNLLFNEKCVLCGSSENVEVHHINPIKKINKKVPKYVLGGILLNRKQILLCFSCHKKVHKGMYDGPRLKKFCLD